MAVRIDRAMFSFLHPEAISSKSKKPQTRAFAKASTKTKNPRRPSLQVLWI
jgi:hypothetical protein